MHKRIKTLLLFSSLFFSFMYSSTLFAKVVDPCWYGCPKEGCSQCGSTGGPIGKIENGDRVKVMATTGEACKDACQKNDQDRIKDCGVHYRSDNLYKKRRDCFKKSKTMLRKCKSTCVPSKKSE